MNTKFYMPTRVIMEDNCVIQNAALFKEYGQSALIVTGANSAKNNGSLQDVTTALSSMKIDYVIYDRVMANPTVSCVYEGAAFAKEKKADFVIGIGGGSPMDAAKAIALLAVQEIPKEDLFEIKLEGTALPLIMIPTTAGTGSEVTANSILSSDMLQTKKSISHPILFPKLALLDAKYMKNLPMTVTINTALDALSHAVEGMLSVRATELSNSIAVESIRTLTPCLKELIKKKESDASNLSKEIREKLLYGSMLAGMVIAHTGTTAVHAMGYSLTYFKNIDHGRANALLLPGFLRFVSERDRGMVEKILAPMELNSLEELDTLCTVLLGEREMISEKELEQFTEISMKAKSIPNSKEVPAKEDIYQIYSGGLRLSN
jgi:alcohol dehydrogenase class IV